MQLFESVRSLRHYFMSPSTKAEEELRCSLLQLISGISVLVFLVAAYVILPVRFGFSQDLFQHPNFKIIHVVMLINLIAYFISKSKIKRYAAYVLPLFFTSLSLIVLSNPDRVMESPFVPFYALTFSIVIGSFVLDLVSGTIFALLSIGLFVGVGYLGSILPLPEIIHRSMIFFILTPIVWAYAYSRKKVFIVLEESTRDHLNASSAQLLAELSGGVAHEVNNPLAIISGYTDGLRQMIAEGKVDAEMANKYLDRISNTTTRISKVTQSMVDLSRRRDIKKMKIYSVGRIINDSFEQFHEMIKSYGIELTIDVSDESLELECNHIQMMLLLLNLVTNSIDAVKGLDERWIKIIVTGTKDIIDLQVIDSGKGIPREHQRDFSNPFFTTKDAGEGSGLGLSICQRIVDHHHGKFSYLKNESNTTFLIQLPARQS